MKQTINLANNLTMLLMVLTTAFTFLACEEKGKKAEEPKAGTFTDARDGTIIHTRENPIKIWGWSKDGKVGISELKFNDNRGGIKITAFVFDAVSDTVLWERNIEHYDDEEDGYSGIPENELAAFFSNFQNVCKQQFGIKIQETHLMVPSGPAFMHNGKTFNVIIKADIEEDNWIRRYSVTAETGGRNKTILSKDAFLPDLPSFSWYSISPFEERALIIIRWASLSHSYGFEYARCNLSLAAH